METIVERYGLVIERIREIAEDGSVEGVYKAYFQKTAVFLTEIADVFEYVKSGRLYQAAFEELQQLNQRLYQDILPDNYEKSYADPAYAVSLFGDEMGRVLSFLYTELRSLIAFAFEKSSCKI